MSERAIEAAVIERLQQRFAGHTRTVNEEVAEFTIYAADEWIDIWEIVQITLAAVLPPLRAREEIAELAKNLRKWAAVFREHPIWSDPKGEFLSVDLETAADAILSSNAGQEWRGIDSAPKDESDLWLARPNMRAVGFWSRHFDKWLATDTGQLLGFQPTHWMHYFIPAPPVAELAQDKRTN